MAITNQKVVRDARLPSDLCQFLSDGKVLAYDPAHCEPGKVGLVSLGDLEIGEVWVGSDVAGDPRFGEDGYYAVPAVSLTAECDAYEPEFILLWLPNEMQYGSWDADHWVLSVFPGVNWAKIVDQPAIYLNAQWDARSEVAEKFIPWPNYDFSPGMPF